MPTPEAVLLTHWRSPGDIVCFTAAVRDLAAAYPERFAIHVGGACPDLWAHNPLIVKAWGSNLPRNLRTISVSCRPQLALANSVLRHYVTAFHHAIEEQLGVPIPALQPHGDLHLSDEEREVPLIQGRYWFLVAGGKKSVATKFWLSDFAQQLVALLGKNGVRLVQSGASYSGHEHFELTGVERVVGQGGLRDALRLIYHAEGVICPVTFAMHVAAALHKPCVVIAGGREPWWWEAYCNTPDRHFGESCAAVSVPHRFLHTQGQLECCRDGGCWKTQLVAQPPYGRDDCVAPYDTSRGQLAPTCMAMITPETVTKAVMSYYQDGTLRSL